MVAQTLPLILSRDFLRETVCHLKICAAREERRAQRVVRREPVIEAQEPFAGAPEVVKIFDGRRIEETLRGGGRQVRQQAEFVCACGKVHADFACGKTAAGEGDAALRGRLAPGARVDVDDAAQFIAELGGDAAG
jgi:hypothetical protein